MSLEKVASEEEPVPQQEDGDEEKQKLTSSKLAKKLCMKTTELLDQLTASGFLEMKNGKHFLTEKGKDAGGEFRMSKKFGPYFLWPESFNI